MKGPGLPSYSGSLTSMTPGEFRSSNLDVLVGAPPSGSSTSTTLGEFDGSNVDVLTGAPPRGARVVRLPGSPAVPI